MARPFGSRCPERSVREPLNQSCTSRVYTKTKFRVAAESIQSRAQLRFRARHAGRVPKACARFLRGPIEPVLIRGAISKPSPRNTKLKYPCRSASHISYNVYYVKLDVAGNVGYEPKVCRTCRTDAPARAGARQVGCFFENAAHIKRWSLHIS